MKSLRPRALVEIDPASGDIRVTLRNRDLNGPAPRVIVDGYTGKEYADDQPLTPDQWAHLERACAERSGTPEFTPAEVRGKAADVRESAAMALAHHGYATMWRVQVDGSCAAWAVVPTADGRAALRTRRGAASGDAARQERTA